MFVGHFALGLAGKAAKPRVSLATWFVSVQLLDLLWPIFVLAGWEHVRIAPGTTAMTPLDFYDYPISHSLVAAIGWGAGFALLYGLLARRRAAAASGAAGGGGSPWPAAGLLALGVVSHWVLDVLVHRPDMPLGVRGPYLGLGLWNHPAAEVAIEGAMFVGGGALYLRATRPRDGVGRYATWLLLAALLVIWLGSSFGPPPPDVRTLGYMGLALWLFVAWAGWCDRHREVPSPATRSVR
jgi:hypothetical protein